jgi:hypothetical protein
MRWVELNIDVLINISAVTKKLIADRDFPCRRRSPRPSGQAERDLVVWSVGAKN